MICKICGISDKDYKGRFYDSGIYGRPLCSAKCYSDWFDKWLSQVVLDNEQKSAQRKRCLAQYYENKDYYRTYQNNKRRNRNIGLAGAL